MTSDDLKTYSENDNMVLDEAFKLFNNSKVINFDVKKNEIDVKYSFNNEIKTLIYNTEKGVIVSGG